MKKVGKLGLLLSTEPVNRQRECGKTKRGADIQSKVLFAATAAADDRWSDHSFIILSLDDRFGGCYQ